jgi:hypothetical protein
VIWSFHPDDPTSFDTLTWHGADRRGAKSLMLLSSVKANDFVPPPDAQHFDMLHHHVRYSQLREYKNVTKLLSMLRAMRLVAKCHYRIVMSLYINDIYGNTNY